MPDPGSRIGPIDILILCTANQCRSPMAQVLLAHHLEEAGIDDVTVTSAGLLPGGRPATAHGVATMADRGLVLDGHESRQMNRAVVEPADLIIGMAREHVREAAVVDKGALARAFTLKELVTGGRAVGRRRGDEPLPDWLARVGANRDRTALLSVGHDPAYDVEDPVGRARGDYEATADELDALLGEVVDLLFGDARPVGQAS